MSKKYEEQFQDSLKDVLNTIFSSIDAEDVTEEVVSGLDDKEDNIDEISPSRLAEITMAKSAKMLQLNLYVAADKISSEIEDKIGSSDVTTSLDNLNTIVDIVNKIESK